MSKVPNIEHIFDTFGWLYLRVSGNNIYIFLMSYITGDPKVVQIRAKAIMTAKGRILLSFKDKLEISVEDRLYFQHFV
jgi:hypothetical protein